MGNSDITGQDTPWKNGWYSLAQRLESPNFGPRPPQVSVDLIVIHSISLPPGIYGGNNVQRFLTNQLPWDEHPYYETIRGLEVSCHFYIDREGVSWQFVSCDDRAWHAGISTYRGRDNCNDYSIGIELEGLDGDTFEAVQYKALGNLCIELKAHYPIAQVTGHEQVAPGRKFDPGKGFDWHLLQKVLGWSAKCFP